MEQSFCYKDKNEWQIVMADILVITANLEHCSSLCNGQFSIKRSKSFYKTIYALVQSHYFFHAWRDISDSGTVNHVRFL